MNQMTGKEKFLFIFLQVITLGLIWIFWIRQKRALSQVDELSYATKTNFDGAALLVLVGTATNVVGLSHTHTKVTISFVDRTPVDPEAIKQLRGVSGVFINDQSVTIIVGTEARAICAQLQAQIPHLHN